MGNASSKGSGSAVVPVVVGDLSAEELARMAEDAGKDYVAEVVRSKQIGGAEAAAIDGDTFEELSGGNRFQRMQLKFAQKQLMEAAAPAAAAARGEAVAHRCRRRRRHRWCRSPKDAPWKHGTRDGKNGSLRK